MGSEELIANLFRISQTESKIKREKISGEIESNKTHYEIGKKVRKAIKSMGGTMPEDLPTPNKSLKQLEKQKINEIISKWLYIISSIPTFLFEINY